MSDLPHLRLENTAVRVPYTHAGGGGGGEFQLPPATDTTHASCGADLQRAEAEARSTRQEQGLTGEGVGEVLAIRSEENFELKLDSLERIQSGIELVSVGIENGVTLAKVFVPRGKYVLLFRIIDSYEARQTPKGRPRNQKLVESMASIRLAAIRDFWEDDIRLFPGHDESIWWEVWLRRWYQWPRRGTSHVR